MAYEAELKFPIGDRAAMRSDLVAIGAVSTGTRTEVDAYLQHPARSFADTDEALRVRQSNAGLFITYKGPKVDDTTKTRTEIELELAAGQIRPSDVLQFWQHLGFQPVREVRKEREILELAWQGRQVHVCLDRVPGIGDFLELELSAEPAQLEESRQILTNLARQLNLQACERRSYLELLLEKEAASADMPGISEDWSE